MCKKIKNLLLAFLGKKIKNPNPIEWRFAVKKGTYNTFKIHFTGFITHPWRLSNQGPSLGGPLPTTFEFQKNEYIQLLDVPKEMGKLYEEFSPMYNAKTSYYTSIVNFVLDTHVFYLPTTLKGKILYMPHTEKKCLELKEKVFQIELN